MKFDYRVEARSPSEAVGERGPRVWELQRVELDEAGDVVDVDVMGAPFRTEAAALKKLSEVQAGLGEKDNVNRNVSEALAKEQNEAQEAAEAKKAAKRTKERASRIRAERKGSKR